MENNIERIEIKVGNNKTLVLEDGILKEKDMTLRDTKRGILGDVLMVVFMFAIFGKTTGIMVGVNNLINRITKFMV